METLMNKLIENNLIDEMGNIILIKYDNGNYQAVDQETFNMFFGNTNFSYEQLIQADGEKGYTRFFNVWRDLGIL